jgi:hypothetical protein
VDTPRLRRSVFGVPGVKQGTALLVPFWDRGRPRPQESAGNVPSKRGAHVPRTWGRPRPQVPRLFCFGRAGGRDPLPLPQGLEGQDEPAVQSALGVVYDGRQGRRMLPEEVHCAASPEAQPRRRRPNGILVGGGGRGAAGRSPARLYPPQPASKLSPGRAERATPTFFRVGRCGAGRRP